ncbi:glycoside hydrolase family 13 [Flavihumibacter stibioxidans]|uniref:Glycoside hydrolase family 13 n=1 Tax=Flavihumibacter stibioxidans TaxID=1834163 RepID=A0ABR7M467_9BACT|nr:glycoside hydrolase family 13 [Flavihumibacter stibioxidans]MBC6489800.1 glycoside hydrolase family 13 [Flavihumibacter stibioxidans]
MSKKVTFTLAPEIVGDATEALLLGDFNNWDINDGIGLKVQKDGSLKATVTLEPGKTYQYRYFLNDGRWVNDANADYYIFDHTYHVDNCVISVPDAEEPASIKADAAAPAKKAAKTEKAAKPKPAAKTKESTPAKDDLTKIEGVGKKIAELLVAENIVTFKDLSKTTAKKLTAILEAAGSKFKVHNPTTWPQQAKLAAAGKWDELKALQAELKGGK